MRWLILLTFSLKLFAGSFEDVTPSTSEEIVSLTTDLLVGDFVSAISGQIALSETDLRVRGAHDLVLKRTYVPPRILGRYDRKDKVDRLILGKELSQLETKGWVVHPHLWAGYNRNSQYFQIPDPLGFVLEFHIQGNRGILQTPSYGCSNLRGERPTSSADIRNIQLLVDGDWVKVTWPHGLTRHYLRDAPGIYHLDREILPNGKTIRYEYHSQGLSKIISTYWTYTPGNLTLTKQKPDGTILPHEYDEHLFLTKTGSREFHYDRLGRLIGGTGFQRILDPFGNILREEWANGLSIETDYDELDRPIIRRLPDHSRIEYTYNGPFLTSVFRFSTNGDALYSHTYDNHDAKGNPTTEQGLFQTHYAYDRKGRRTHQHNPYYTETVEYNPSGNLVRKNNTLYTYDLLSQMTSESDQFTACYDTHYNLTKLNHHPIEIDSLNQIEGLQYDLNGNLLRPGFVYDEFDQLIEAAGETITYDALGRRMQKGDTSFLYIGEEEIGAFEQGVAKELKIPGNTTPIAIEINQVPYAPIVDVQGVIRSLVDVRTQEIFKQNHCDAFATGLSDEIPYAYSGKRYDPNLQLIYFGKRYYDPTLRRWLSPDPIGSSDHSNLYQYVFNNPYSYQDENGEFAAAVVFIPLLLSAEFILPVAYGAAMVAVAYSGCKLMDMLNDRYSRRDYYSRDLTPDLHGWSYSITKNGSVDPSLPANPDDLLERPGWEETTHPEAGKHGHRTFENKDTGERLRHDEGKPGESGHEKHDHYHRPNPNKNSKRDEYLDHNYDPVGRHSDSSHLYAPENVWWD